MSSCVIYNKDIKDMIADSRDKQIIDIREPEEFLKGSYPGAANYPWKEFDSYSDNLSKDSPIYLICHSGKKSMEICEELAYQGYEAYSIQGGIYSYYVYLMDNQYTDLAVLEEKRKSIEHSIIKKFRKELWSQFTKAINVYDLRVEFYSNLIKK